MVGTSRMIIMSRELSFANNALLFALSVDGLASFWLSGVLAATGSRGVSGCSFAASSSLAAAMGSSTGCATGMGSSDGFSGVLSSVSNNEGCSVTLSFNSSFEGSFKGSVSACSAANRAASSALRSNSNFDGRPRFRFVGTSAAASFEASSNLPS